RHQSDRRWLARRARSKNAAELKALVSAARFSRRESDARNGALASCRVGAPRPRPAPLPPPAKALKLADLVLWTPAFCGVKPDLVIRGDAIAAAAMGDPNASIPTPQPVHYRIMFGGFGRARLGTSLTFVSDAALSGGLARRLRVEKRLVAVENTRGKLRKKNMVHNGATPKIESDSETYAVTVDGEVLVCEPAEAADGAEVFLVLRRPNDHQLEVSCLAC